MRAWHGVAGSLLCLALIATDCVPAEVSSVTVTPSDVTLSLGEPTQLSATVTYFAHPDDPYISDVTWSEVDASIASV